MTNFLGIKDGVVCIKVASMKTDYKKTASNPAYGRVIGPLVEKVALKEHFSKGDRIREVLNLKTCPQKGRMR